MIDLAGKRFIRNPDVVLREEDEDGALLFNPDTNQILVINTTGLFVWKACDGTPDLESLVTAIKQNFDQVPGEVDEQVTAYLDHMLTQTFLGTVE